MKRYFKMLVCFAVVVLCALAVISSFANVSAASEENQKWVGAWGTAPTQLDIDGFGDIASLVGDVTVRVVITPTASGEKFRLKLSNYYGNGPMRVKRMTVSKSLGKSKIDINNIAYITFDGSLEAVVDPGKEIYSDPVAFPIKAQEPIAISIFVSEYQDVNTMGLSGATAYFTTGDAVIAEDYDLIKNVIDDEELLDLLSKLLGSISGSTTIDPTLSYSFIKFVPALASLEVLTDDSAYSVVVVGDSTVADVFPEYLAEAIYQQGSMDKVGVVGKGVVGNRILGGGLGLGSTIYADSLISRFPRDVLNQAGVEYVIMKIGANDIIHPVCLDIIEQYPGIQQPTAEEIINGYRRIFKDCHDAGIKVIVMGITQWKGTTTDYLGTGAKYIRTEAEFQKDWKIAQDVNQWLANTNEHDGFVDLAEISANPLDKDALLPEYTTDGIHPTQACQRLWSNYFPLSLIGIGTKPGNVRIEEREAAIAVGEEKQINATILPETALDKSLIWESSDPSVVSVDENGVVKGLANGSATISCKTVIGGFKAYCTVTVTTKPDGIMLDYTEREIYTTRSVTLEAFVFPETATNKNVKWTSSNTKVATVDQSGKVTGVGEGTATITVETSVGGLTAKCTVTVLKKREVQSVIITYGNEQITSKTLYTNDTSKVALGYTVSPTNATFKDVTWTSSNPKVATVDPMGNVKAVSAGKTVIKCSSEDNPMATASCTVTVKVRATGVELSSSSFRVYETKSKSLKATITPEDASNKSVTWKSSDTKIAKVDKNGKVTGVKPGTVYITATTANGRYSAKCKVTVLKVTYSEKVKLNKTSITLDDGKTYTLKATVLPDNTTTKTVTWSSSNTKVAKVDSYGEVTAVNPGTAYIYCKTKDTGKEVKCKVTVKEVKPTSVSFASKTIEVEYGDIVKLKATVKPSNATDKSLVWSSSDPKVVKVSQAGNVKGLKAGKSAVITVTTNTGKLKAKITVKVNPIGVSKITLNKKSATLSKGNTLQLKATVSPSNATNKTLTWTSSNTKVATVDKNGKVTTLKNGTATITCKSANGKTATCKITVKNIPVTGIKLDKTSVLADKGVSFTVKATISPSNATIKDIKWTTSDKKVATISSSGKVTAVAPGVCQITATTVDGEFTAVCMITVK